MKGNNEYNITSKNDIRYKELFMRLGFGKATYINQPH